jgi:hypothetical protein
MGIRRAHATEVALRTPWFRVSVVVVTIILAAAGLWLAAPSPSAAAATGAATTPAPSDTPSLTDRLKGLLGAGKTGGYNGQATLPSRPAAPAAKPAGKAKRVKELTGKRTTRAKFFELEDGRVEAELSAAPVHYQDVNGDWRELDTRIGEAGRPGFAYGNHTNHFGSLFGTTSDRLLRFEQDGRHVTVGLPGAARNLAPKARDSRVTYPGALDGADLVYQVAPDGVKEQIVLDRPPAEWPRTG